MTILEASNKLIEYFAQNTHFEIGSDFKKVCLISDTDADEAAILIALEEMSKNNFVSRKEVGGKTFWILFKPLALQTQEVTISLVTALGMAETINKFINNDNEKVNPLNISEQDIVNLITVAKRA